MIYTDLRGRPTTSGFVRNLLFLIEGVCEPTSENVTSRRVGIPGEKKKKMWGKQIASLCHFVVNKLVKVINQEENDLFQTVTFFFNCL